MKLPFSKLTPVILLPFFFLTEAIAGDTLPVKEALMSSPAEGRSFASGDVISVTIWRKTDHSETELDESFTVDKEGDINLPTIGKIKAANLTAKQLENSILTQAKRFLKSPEVSVVLAQTKILKQEILANKEEIDRIIALQVKDKKKENARVRKDVVETPEGYDIGISKDPKRIPKVKPNVLRYTSILEERKPKEYRINVDDVLDITVWQNPELSKEVTVRSDGRITLLLAGDLQAEGLTTTELKDAIAKKLSTFVINPQVAVTLKKFGGKRVVVLGEVRQPGLYKLDANARLMEAIGMAWGFTHQAFTGSVLLSRADPYNNPRIFIIDTYDIMGRGRVDKNIMLEQYDVVYVPRTKVWNVANLLLPFAAIVEEVKTATKSSTDIISLSFD